MSQPCDYANRHGVKCGLDLGHPGGHALAKQLAPPAPFCIEPTDTFAPAIIRGWITLAKCAGVNQEKLERAEERLGEIVRWQKEHGTKLPD